MRVKKISEYAEADGADLSAADWILVQIGNKFRRTKAKFAGAWWKKISENYTASDGDKIHLVCNPSDPPGSIVVLLEPNPVDGATITVDDHRKNWPVTMPKFNGNGHMIEFQLATDEEVQVMDSSVIVFTFDDEDGNGPGVWRIQ